MQHIETDMEVVKRRRNVSHPQSIAECVMEALKGKEQRTIQTCELQNR